MLATAESTDLPGPRDRTARVAPPSTKNTGAPYPAVDDGLTEACRTALREFVDRLRRQGRLNTVPGGGWVVGDTLLLVGKEAADALRRHPALRGRARQFQQNTVLYRALAAAGLTECGPQKPVWQLKILENLVYRALVGRLSFKWP